ncbi:MAG: hypothetical protein JWM85_3141 [Acidimicrobiaceae bacterium]|nr:hypothetical protein [Acidimicrobiaceae bacterium]
MGVTYALVDHSLPIDTVAQPRAALSVVQTEPLYKQCQAGALKGTRQDPGLEAKCQSAFSTGARVGATDQRANDLRNLLLFSLLGLVGGTALVGGLGWSVGRRVLRPLQRVTAAARRASFDHLDERLALVGPHDELKELADTFDGMLDRLTASSAGQRRFVANASHELRTPLTEIQTTVDVTLAKSARTIEQLEASMGEVRLASKRAETTIEALLTLARSDAGLTRTELVDLPTAVTDALDLVESQARAFSVTVEAELGAAETLGDRVLVERLVANLVDNAVRYNHRGGWARVVTGRVEHRPFIEVQNTGQQLPEEIVPGLFEPFRRLDDRVESPGGSGLGLSIVASVAAAHRGSVVARARPEGGLAVRVTFDSEADAPDHDGATKTEPG